MKRKKHPYSALKRITLCVYAIVIGFALCILVCVPAKTYQILKESNQKYEEMSSLDLTLLNEDTIHYLKDEGEDDVALATECDPIIEMDAELHQPTVNDKEEDKMEGNLIDIDKEVSVLHPVVKNPPTIVNLQENLSDWFLKNESNEELSIWKVTDADNNLYIALKNTNEEFVATFKYEGQATENYGNWTLCDDFFSALTTTDICDCSFVVYREVSGNNAENAQIQLMVFINRVYHPVYPNTIREVVVDQGQYQNYTAIINRWLKLDHYLEREDLEKCFRQVLLVLAGETIVEVPSDVVYAAGFLQGSGIWKVIGKTYYCYY